jgi:hypothetical protein
MSANGRSFVLIGLNKSGFTLRSLPHGVSPVEEKWRFEVHDNRFILTDQPPDSSRRSYSLEDLLGGAEEAPAELADSALQTKP